MTSEAESSADTGATLRDGFRTEPARAHHQKWGTIFAAFEDEQASRSGVDGARPGLSARIKRRWKLLSLPGFIFGPLYYFYLRMWRKGLLIIALAPILAIAGTIIDIKGAAWIIPLLCMTMAKRDYFKFCIRGETMWPWARFSKNIWTDAALVIIVGLGFTVGLAVVDSSKPGASQTAHANASSEQALKTRAANGDLPDLADWELTSIEHEGGMSGLDCTITRRLMPQIYLMRRQGMSLDSAKDYVYVSNSGERTNLFMWKTVEQTYENPVKMQKLISSGLWSKACVKYIRGY